MSIHFTNVLLVTRHVALLTAIIECTLKRVNNGIVKKRCYIVLREMFV